MEQEHVELAKQSINLQYSCQDPHYLALILSSLISPVFWEVFHLLTAYLHIC